MITNFMLWLLDKSAESLFMRDVITCEEFVRISNIIADITRRRKEG